MSIVCQETVSFLSKEHQNFVSQHLEAASTALAKRDINLTLP
jgi:hypothetical protein